MSDTLVLAVPSKGRLMDQTASLFTSAGLTLRKVGSERGYRGEIAGLDGVEVTFVSASDIATLLAAGRVHLGITGEDLIREQIVDADARVSLLAPLGFGRADVVAAAPAAWIDVRRMTDLEAAAMVFQRVHGRRLRVATKYMNLTRRYFAAKGVTGYRIVESLGATEGTPAAGAAELIVDITTTGTTLKANGLKVLEDGVILKSQAHLVASTTAPVSPAVLSLQQALVTALSGARDAADAVER
jgi:ATP phosphoribosyltransferase